MNRIIVNLHNASGVLESRNSILEGTVHGVTLRSTHLVSAGQSFSFAISATVQPAPEPGSHWVDARGVVDIEQDWQPTWDYDTIPSHRTLSEILAEAVKHGVDYPTHGSDCSCQDNLVREIRQHVRKNIPEWREDMTSSEGWERRMDALSRVRSILNMVARGL